MNDKENEKGIQSIQKIILEKLRCNFAYVPAESRKDREEAPAPNIDFGDRKRCAELAQIPAFLRTYFKMSEIRGWCGKTVRDESDDKLIYSVLDGIAKGGLVRFLRIVHIPDARFDEFQFYVEVGIGWSNFAQTDNKNEAKRFYQDVALKKSERSGSILDVEKQVEIAFKRQREALERRYGKPVDTDIERKLWREELMGNYELGASQIKLARALENKSEEKKV